MSSQNEVWFAIRTDVADGGGSGSPNDPSAVNPPSNLWLVLLFLSAFSGITSLSQTNTLIVPREAGMAFGSSSADPFFFSEGYAEQIYASSEFSEGTNDIFLITAVAFRVNETPQTTMNAIKPSILLRMNVFEGTMEEVVQRKSGVTQPHTVFSAEAVHLAGRSGDKDRFDVMFLLQAPFTYDRRAGHLVLNIVARGQYSGEGASMDAHGIDGFGRGTYIFMQPFAGPLPTSQILVSRFFYRSLFVVIQSIKRVGDRLYIDFAVIGSPPSVKIESSPDINGTFTNEHNVELTSLTEPLMRANVPLPSTNRFFRVSLR